MVAPDSEQIGSGQAEADRSDASAAEKGDLIKDLDVDSGQDTLLMICRVISVVNVTATLASAVVCSVSVLTRLGEDRPSAVYARSLSVALCVLVCCAECDWSIAKAIAPLSDYMVCRGFLQISAGALMDVAHLNTEDAEMLLSVVIMAQESLGLFQIAGGLLCLGPVKRWRQRLAERRDVAVRELAALENRRKELEAMIKR